jgi:hypothetical protein
MNTPKIPIQIADLIHEHITTYGELDVETGLFLAAPRGSGTATTVAFAGSRGVERHCGLLALSGRAISQLLRFLAEHDLVALTQVHSHRGPAGLSRTDLAHGFSVEGFTSAVIPHYRRPAHDPGEWGWWRYQAGRWRDTAPFALTGDAPSITAVSFDEDGVHARR